MDFVEVYFNENTVGKYVDLLDGAYRGLSEIKRLDL